MDQHRPPGLELRLLESFLALVEEGHFGRAARRVHVAQSPFSRQIRQLEAAVGCTLVERGPHGMTGLTAAGDVLAERAPRVLAEVTGLVEATTRVVSGEVGVLRLGFVNEVTADLLPLGLRRYREEHPQVDVQLEEGRTRTQLDALAAGTLDVAFVRSPADLEGLEYEVLVVEELMLARPDPGGGSPDERWSLADCAGHDLVLPSAEVAEGLRRDILGSCREAGFEPIATHEDASLPALLLHVAAGEGVALVPASIAHQYPVPGVRYDELDEPGPRSSVGIAWRAGPLRQTAADFVEVVRDLAASMEGSTDIWPERHVVDRPPRAEDSSPAGR